MAVGNAPRLALSVALALASGESSAVDPPPWFQPIKSDTWSAEVKAKTGSNGAAKSDSKYSCFEMPKDTRKAPSQTRSPSEFFLLAATQPTNCAVLSKSGFHQCWIDFQDFIEVQPGVSEPRSACAYVHVRSRSGKAGVSSKIRGEFVASSGTHVRASPPNDPSDSILSPRTSFTPGLYRTVFDPDSPIGMTFAIPLVSIEALVRDNLAAQLRKQSWGFATLTKFQFDGYAAGEPTLQLSFGIDSPIVKCNPRVKFWIAHTTPADTALRFGQLVPDCSNKGELAGGAGLAEELTKSLASALSESLNSAIGETSDFAKWSQKDPSWKELVSRAHLQGRYCNVGGRSLCITLAWDHEKVLRQFASKYSRLAPSALGQIDQADLLDIDQKLVAFRAAASSKAMKQSTTDAGFKYPAAKDGKGAWRDRDVVIYSGLLCLIGEEVGCDAVRRAQGPSGQWWRSPDLVDTKPKDGDSFSGDQLNGVIAYLLTKRDPVAFSRWLTFVRSRKSGLPTDQTPLDYGYRTCTDDRGITCLLGGPDWYWINGTAAALQAIEEVPSAERVVERRYGFSLAMIYWQSVIAPAGYRLHLTGIQILLSRKLGLSSPELVMAASVLAGRQSNNPFYLFLHLGSDKRVLDITNQKCAIAAAQSQLEDWAWQNAEVDEKWKSSMLWDCVFMYRLLSASP